MVTKESPTIPHQQSQPTTLPTDLLLATKLMDGLALMIVSEVDEALALCRPA